MKLIDNKKVIIYDKTRNRVYWKEENIRNSNWDIECSQIIWLSSRISSNFLIRNIYYDEINRE